MSDLLATARPASMAIEIRRLYTEADYMEDMLSDGLVFYCNTSGQVLEGIETKAFEDIDEAEFFLQWLYGGGIDLRQLSVPERHGMVRNFRTMEYSKHQQRRKAKLEGSGNEVVVSHPYDDVGRALEKTRQEIHD